MNKVFVVLRCPPPMKGNPLLMNWRNDYTHSPPLTPKVRDYPTPKIGPSALSYQSWGHSCTLHYACCTCCELHMLQISYVAICTCFKLLVFQNVCLANCRCCKLCSSLEPHLVQLSNDGPLGSSLT